MMANSTTADLLFNTTNVSDPVCSLFPNSPDNCLTLVYTKRVFTSIAMLGSIITITIVIFFKKYGEFSQRLIIHLSLASFLLAFAGWLGDINTEPTPLCIAQGAIIMYSAAAVSVWIMTIMLNIYKLAIFGTSLETWEKVVIPVCWIIPFIFMGVPFIGRDVYGPAGAWCWFVNKWEWIFGAWYFWRILSVIAIIILTVRIIYGLRTAARTRRTDEANFKALNEDIRTLRIYPVAYFIVNVFQIIDRSYQSINGRHSEQFAFPLTLMHCIMGFSFGTVLCLIFVLDRKTLSLLTPKKIKKTYRQKWRKSRQIREFNVGSSSHDQAGNTNMSFEN